MGGWEGGGVALYPGSFSYRVNEPGDEARGREKWREGRTGRKEEGDGLLGGGGGGRGKEDGVVPGTSPTFAIENFL